MLFGIPEQDQVFIRDRGNDKPAHRGRADPWRPTPRASQRRGPSPHYLDWRAEHPSDDIMTDLLQAEFDNETGAQNGG